MSLRQQNLGSIIKPGYNPLAQNIIGYTYNLFAWGDNSAGQLGQSNTTPKSSPTQVGSLTTWSVVFAGSSLSAAIKTDGTLWMWGDGGGGTLGQGNNTSYSSPKQVGALTNWADISTASAFAAAVKTDGTLWTWGTNANGELGLGNRTSYSSPKQVGALTNWQRVYTTQGSTLALKTDGTLWGFGENASGILGLGNITKYSSPKQVGSLTNWTQNICTGTAFALAVKTDGTLWSWGSNANGKLGLGNTTNYSSPIQIGLLTSWSKVGATADSGMATRTTGQLWVWGSGNSGRLGLNNTTSYSSPKQVGALTDWGTFSTNGYGSDGAAVIKTDGTLWTWGGNSGGRLGVGNTTNYSSPKQVGSSTFWQKISTSNNALAIG